DEILKTYYKIEAEIKTNDAFVLKEMGKMGLFILASNDINLRTYALVGSIYRFFITYLISQKV
ncbi:MAG: hypothetical protein QG646_3393, partial [Euryarchaeota archaeon]|nr:hypothetical protein [Euryarchaeota archaeon]